MSRSMYAVSYTHLDVYKRQQYKREHGVVWKRPARYKNEDLWGKATIYRMLTNRSYAGDMEQGLSLIHI